jgi:transposase-like protein
MRAEVGPDIREAFTARSEEPAQRLFDLGSEKYEKKASTLAAWMIDNIPIDSACSGFPDRIAGG